FHRAEQRVDAGIVRNVVTEIGHRRGKDRRQPDRVHAERFQIRQAPADPPDIANPVTVGILKRPRIDLIEDAVPPPILVALIHALKLPSVLLRKATPKLPPGSEQYWATGMTGRTAAPSQMRKSFPWRTPKNRQSAA